MARRQHLTLTVLLVAIVFFSLVCFFSRTPMPSPRFAASLRTVQVPLSHDEPLVAPPKSASGKFEPDLAAIPSLSQGDSIAPKLENATLKAELGRATWKFLHTMVSRFPDKPTDDERKTLELFFHLFGRLYPCGDCARHFREMLDDFPPQTSSRNAAAGWLCASHNRVNKRLKKPQFDCTKIGDFYDCGCGDDKGEKGEKGKNDKDDKSRH